MEHHLHGYGSPTVISGFVEAQVTWTVWKSSNTCVSVAPVLPMVEGDQMFTKAQNSDTPSPPNENENFGLWFK